MIRRGGAVVSVATLATAGLAFAVGTNAVGGVEDAASPERSFEEVGEHTYVVPEGVCSVTIEVWGAEGGDGAVVPFEIDVPLDAGDGTGDINTNGEVPPVGAAEADETAPSGDASGGEGGYATASIPVTPGDKLTVNVGESGGDASGLQGGLGGESDAGDGGDGGTAFGFIAGFFAGGGGGGGASSVEHDDEDLIVAGGGGGGGGTGATSSDTGVPGGDGGGEGEDGATARSTTGSPSPSAEGGEAGGEGGDGGVNPVIAASNGADSDGDNGGKGGDAVFQGGGGGGGGATGGGGGAGSSLGTIVGGGGGGGGSGSGPDDAEFEDGGNDGDGEVTISYDPVADACAAEAIEIEPKFTG